MANVLSETSWCRFHNLVIRDEVKRWILGLDAAYGCTHRAPHEGTPKRMSGANIGPPLCLPNHEFSGCVCPVGAPFAGSLKGTLWANCGTVCVHFFQSGWHHYFLISVKLLYFTSHIISKRSFRIHWASKDFLNYHIRHNNTTTVLQRN